MLERKTKNRQPSFSFRWGLPVWERVWQNCSAVPCQHSTALQTTCQCFCTAVRAKHQLFSGRWGADQKSNYQLFTAYQSNISSMQNTKPNISGQMQNLAGNRASTKQTDSSEELIMLAADISRLSNISPATPPARKTASSDIKNGVRRIKKNLKLLVHCRDVHYEIICFQLSKKSSGTWNETITRKQQIFFLFSFFLSHCRFISTLWISTMHRYLDSHA